ncbi:MAG TPA: DUF4337 domain-containing protein [Steroidobacteraceae bacterium]|nr:DUF4337 domain-containing protein [Steroidobacteraceae bacterium]
MADIEIHAGEAHAGDALSKGVSVMVAVIGIVLALVTIGSHRAHTASVIHRTEANDQWAFYEAKKIREHMVDIAASLATTVTVTDAQKARALAESFAQERDRYDREAKDIEREAQSRETESEREERRALRLDVGDGFLELGLVLSSLYFLSKRRFFPVMGATAALIGTVVSAASWLV